MSDDRLIQEEVVEEGVNLRPENFCDYIGQGRVKERIMLYMQAAKARNQSVDHILLGGSAGLGKSSIARIIAKSMNSNYKYISAPSIKSKKEFCMFLAALRDKDVLFIDEIHRLSNVFCELLFPILEDHKLEVRVEDEYGYVRDVSITLNNFTVIGATTIAGSLSTMMRDRFPIRETLEFYSPEDLKEIIIINAKKLEVDITEDGAMEIAKRSRNTPRVCIRLLKRVRDIVQINENNTIDLESAKKSLQYMEIDEMGLDKIDISILNLLIERNKPMGIRVLSANIAEEPSTIENEYQPFLLRKKLIEINPKGVKATDLAYSHLKVERKVDLESAKIL